MKRMIPVLILALFLLSSCLSIGPAENRIEQRDNPNNSINQIEMLDSQYSSTSHMKKGDSISTVINYKEKWDNQYNMINHTEHTETYRFSYYVEEIMMGDPNGFFPYLKNLEDGDTFTFGYYNGEGVSWIVLSVLNGRITAVSSRPLLEYGWAGVGSEFEDSILDNRLNGKFLYEYFSEYERTLIGNHVGIPSVGQSSRMRRLYIDAPTRFHGWMEASYWYAIDGAGNIVKEGLSGSNRYPDTVHADVVIPLIEINLDHERQFIY